MRRAVWLLALGASRAAALLTAVKGSSKADVVAPDLEQKATKVKGILNFMELHSDEPDAVAVACSRLGGEAYNGGRAVQDLVVLLGGVQACIGALRSHVNHSGVVQSCGSGLGGVIVFNNLACKVSAALGGIEALAAGIRAHEDERKVMLTIDVFSSHCDLNPENRPRVRQAGGIDLILESMRRFYSDGEVQFKNWAGLSATVHDPENREAIARGSGWCPPGCGAGELRGIELLVQTMRDLRSSHRVNQEAMQVAKGLLDHSAEYRDALVEAGLIAEIVKTVREREREELGTPCVGAEALTKLALMNPGYRVRIALSGVVSDIVRAMQNRLTPDSTNYGGSTNADVWPTLSSGCRFLEVMAGDLMARETLTTDSGAMSLVSNLASAGQSAAIRSACNATLGQLTV
mmetsp:Transcript_43312/g.134730  ORF Transcript_43312/g.134730 Transcript_43312/m.134730 type:complete len:405 (+) Transcript_43312:65-1279(+)|eukprot:CAMPEP_0204596010 /NCGR_PEP_ID=MMETSP0661-20131031/52988_1 /ASSEMBLY_ACC=CAM_ASM_000606 /TAXON_ID=109239 /ORGANISM="Alexandrium margalefi, Strain AMGDE01CS-322" /LENGTH=404 /DNA_ID=CAMNT_0051606585 /DNA_START=65 /DNA_END=1279 /DNA_ORIENTATION=-